MTKMKGLSFVLVLMLIFTSIFTNTVMASAEAKETVTITVLGTTDMHGNIYDWSYEDQKEDDDVGLAKIYTIVKKVREENPNTLLLDNGDTLQGTILTDDIYNKDLTKPNPMIDVMNFMGYDAMTLGNHEFNFGLELIDKAVKEAEFPIVSANIYKKDDGSNFVKPYVVKEVGGIKVGILGLTTPNIPLWDGPKVTNLKFEHMGNEAEKYVKILNEEEKVDLIIATAHAGLEGRHHETEGDAAKHIIDKAPEIEALLLGHDHKEIAEEINGTLVGAADDKGNQVVRFDLTLENQDGTWVVVDKKVQLIETKEVAASEELREYAKDYHEATNEFLTEELGKATGNFHPESEVPGIPEAQIRDTAVIDFINEVQLEYTGADVSAAALFKPTSNIKEGPITYSNIFDIYKYPNTLMAVEVTGKELKEYMEWSAAYFNTYKPGDVTISFDPNIRGYNYDMFAGVDYKIDISKPVGERIVDLKFKGKTVTDEQILKLAVNNYRFGSTLKSKGMASNVEYFNSDPKSIRSFIADYIKEKGTIKPTVDNNWEIIGADLNHPLRDYIIEQVKEGNITVPTSEDGRTPNVKSLNVYELIKEGKIPQEKLDELGIDYTPITIVHTNDTHARIEAGKYAGMGFAKIASKIKEIKENNPNVLVLDAGDTFHGQTIASIVKGESVVKVMNTIGYDAMTAGNHDFNYGQDRLVELSEKTNFPILSANVIKEDGTKLLESYTIKEVGGIKVGIFGLSTPETAYKTHPKNVEGLTFKDPVEAAKEMVEELKDKADVIIALAHLGMDESSQDTSVKVAQEVEGIDVIIDGHSHTTLLEGKKVNGTLIVQAGEYDKNLGIVDLVYQDKKVSLSASLLTKEEAASLDEDEEILAAITDIKTEIEKITSVVVGNTDINLDGERGNVRTGETNLGNLIATAMLKVTGADIAFTNGGGIRASIEPGEITKGEVITVLPFGNYVVVKEVKGADILSALEHGIDSYPETKGAFPHVDGMTFKFDPSKEAGSRLVEVKVAGEILDPEKTYKLATNDFLAAGGDGYEMFADDKIIGEYPGLDEVLIAHIGEYGTADAKVDGRIEAIKIEDNASTEMKTYVVVPGDVLWKIAKKYNLQWKTLAEFNKMKNPNIILPGQKILIPVQ